MEFQPYLKWSSSVHHVLPVRSRLDGRPCRLLRQVIYLKYSLKSTFFASFEDLIGILSGKSSKLTGLCGFVLPHQSVSDNISSISSDDGLGALSLTIFPFLSMIM